MKEIPPNGPLSLHDGQKVNVDFMQKMCDSGYSHPTRMEVVVSPTRKYYRQLMDQKAGEVRLYRSTSEMAKARKVKTWPGLNLKDMGRLKGYSGKEIHCKEGA